jgi:TatD DNase family protein
MGKFKFIDTHCHIHFPDYLLDSGATIERADKAGVEKLILVGCTLTDSKLGVDMAGRNENIWASIGLHPHEAKQYVHAHDKLQQFTNLASKPKVVAIGEIGLDYHYMHSPKSEQKKMLKFQLDIAVKHDLPVIFHVRDAFDDFFEIFDQYKNIRGVVHSFTASLKRLEQVTNRGLYVGLNGIITFTKDKKQLAMAKAVPQGRMLLETDAPFLTPAPFRGTICEPKHVFNTAEFLASLRGENLEDLARQTTKNAVKLFGI